MKISSNILDKEKKKKLCKIISRFSGKKILVIGDMSVDKFIEGNVTKISPEAPIPILDITSEYLIGGRAANVINNLHALNAQPWVASVVGEDSEGNFLISELKKRNVDTEGIAYSTKPTPLITRVKTSTQQILRLDRENQEEINPEIAKKISDYINKTIEQVDIVLLSDYGGGIITPELMDAVKETSKKNGKKIIVNPKKGHLNYYDEVSIIRANLMEASYITGIKPVNETSIRNMMHKISTMCKAENVLITWIEKGFYLYESPSDKAIFIPPLINRIISGMGVGDTIVSVLALSLAAGATFEDSAVLANYAGVLVANKSYLSTTNPKELEEKIINGFHTME